MISSSNVLFQDAAVKMAFQVAEGKLFILV